MICDVNPLIYAHREESPNHEDWLGWLRETLRDGNQLDVPGIVALGFYRIVTNRRIFARPSLPSEAMAFLDEVFAVTSARIVSEGPRHWAIFQKLCAERALTGADATDAYIAAFALELDVELISADRGFERFSSLRLRNPVQ